MTRKVSEKDFKFLQEELLYHKKSGNLTEEQMNNIIGEYENAGKSFNFMKVVLTIGAVLVGLGILSFIASNWQVMGRPLKLSLIILSYLGINILSFKANENYPKLSESLLLVGVAIYGAGIFLIGQMFHFGGHFTSAFLLWTVGILPMAYLLKDKTIYFIAIILSFIYLNGHFSMGSFPLISIVLIITFYYLNNKSFKNSATGLFLINLSALNLLAVFISTNNLINLEDYFPMIFFIVGLAMYYAPIKENKYIIKLQGNLVFGLSGLAMTFSYSWEFLQSGVSDGGIATTVSIVFSVIYVILLLYLVKYENLMALAFICFTIFRYYVDTMYDFMPKSLFFLTSGLILLGFGYYIERRRRKTGGIINE